MRTVKRTIVSAILMSSDDKILLGKVREGGVYPNCWHIPGGGVEEGETKELALIREMHEEIGLDITRFSKKLVRDTDTDEADKTDKQTGETYHVIMQFNVYQINIPIPNSEINIELHDDLTEYRWVSINDLPNYQHTTPSQKLFKSLGYLPKN